MEFLLQEEEKIRNADDNNLPTHTLPTSLSLLLTLESPDLVNHKPSSQDPLLLLKIMKVHRKKTSELPGRRAISLFAVLLVVGVAHAFSTTTSTTSGKFNPDKTLPLEGCVCLVTGASRGIGKGIAVELGGQGATVYVTGTSSSSSSILDDGTSKRKRWKFWTKQKRNQHTTTEKFAVSADTGGPGTIEETAAAVTKAGGIGIPIRCNHADDNQVRACIEQIAEEQDGRLDILVNNAFRVPTGGPKALMSKFWEQSLETWDAVHAVGLRSHYVTSVLAMPLLQKAKEDPHPGLPRPFIAMISSFGGISYSFNVPYGVAKCAVDRLCKDMAVELKDDISVVSFYPGLVKTERTDLSVESGDWEAYVKLPLDNSETPQFTGKAIVAVATDPTNLDKTGTYQVVAELAEEYNFVDINGKRPPSIRSLRFLLPTYGMTPEQRDQIDPDLIPDWKLPFFIMAGGKPPDQDD